jgi:phage-related protein
MGTTVETEAEGMNLALSVGPLIAIVAIGVAVMELVKHWRGAWTAIKEAFHLAWDGIKDVFRGALNFIEHGGFVMFGPMIIGLVELVKHWRGAWTAVKDVVKGVWDFIKNIFDQITKGFDNLRHGIATVANDLSHPWKILGLAGGGTAMAGHTYMVGEQGPELFTPGTTGTITPHNSSKGAGGATINITGYNLADPSQTAAEIAWKLKTSPSGTT